MKTARLKHNNGQIMMIVVMVLSGVIVGALAISGLLTARQTRQTADIGNSSKAVFAADAGIEWRLFKFIKDNYVCKNCNEGNVCGEKPFGDDVLTTTCVLTGSDADYDYFRITSSAKYANSSYVIMQDISIVK